MRAKVLQGYMGFTVDEIIEVKKQGVGYIATELRPGLNDNAYFTASEVEILPDDLTPSAAGAPMGATSATMRTFDTGATRSNDAGKIDPEGFLSPLVIERYCRYLNKHRVQADGKLRDSDNWQKGMGLATYMKSKWRHFLDMWKMHRTTGPVEREVFEDTICADLFNTMGYLHEYLKGKTNAS